jgi:hypothetical protein
MIIRMNDFGLSDCIAADRKITSFPPAYTDGP